MKNKIQRVMSRKHWQLRRKGYSLPSAYRAVAKKHIPLKMKRPYKDTDRDGVVNRYDCQPRNRYRQDDLTEEEYINQFKTKNRKYTGSYATEKDLTKAARSSYRNDYKLYRDDYNTAKSLGWKESELNNDIVKDISRYKIKPNDRIKINPTDRVMHHYGVEEPLPTSRPIMVRNAFRKKGFPTTIRRNENNNLEWMEF